MKNICSVRRKSDRRVKQLDDDFYCSEFLDKCSCLKCNMLFDVCVNCHKKLCGCIECRVIYGYGGVLFFSFRLL